MSSGRFEFTGSIVALVTPMDASGQVDKASLKKLIDYHVASGTSAIVSVGTTGESATLSHDEHGDVVLTTIELADGRIPVIAGTGANATAEAISLTKRFENSGVVGCLTVTPYYNKPSQEGLYQHFKTIAENTDLPQILYNVPSRTGCDLLPLTVARLAKIKNIVAIKEATGNLNRVSQIQELVNDDSFILLSGDDASGLDFIQLGGKGVISVTANIAAPDVAKFCELALNGQFAEARKLNNRLMDLHRQLFVEPNPIPVKWGCQKLGLIADDTVRLPMTPLTDAGKVSVEKALKMAGLL
ncbi:4-hydroxy-tetrahydrodipicolinate synthase [Photorhabdus laumondii subsp. laumondii]|uniref:4-hydroxy-tetrahydrodipicolinate synthase n=3 Tax=Photorhabdus laumondii TaxID=2218628 RepID=Q7N3H1_PHOLL|nr:MULTISPECIES: 4-hydroxy-tetrahydrodipicolinate synthase [Photorhabdus]PQQ39530.1 4-hydroxy-tetrahydrodipicolinate synthase [Photorhabdus luminescens]AWK42470.1 4-hydroxy-tetrahydrodipicolinate synthase [Photorhabdus laumondii subsp. laumondii]AXG43319.1 4-hydroxy-tetrahydrodipicolinate synthase [Photorhabdus laumondii subsp. laumondii]AXG47792.1 4-hydroxy-tetrahydrodipicolinate synthase [Photorhabdus laumondii subsp. laumondii]KTL63524.1 4-hydroxy-tetrahydrodipicolinate synthase [Photorhabd